MAHQFTCPSGLHFNKDADSCDYVRNVHCSKTSPTTPSTTEKTEKPTTPSTRASSSTRANPFYNSPSRTTQRTTTTATYVEPITDLPDLDQEDPKVIKELIDLIRKVGGVEELERQLNLQDDGATVTIKSKQEGATTEASILNKTLFEKIKNRASVFKTKPAFNGASQPEVKERTETKEQRTSKPETTPVSKVYKSVSRNRPEPQNVVKESPPESENILNEKPQYTAIRRKPVRPAVILENDYNGDPENLSKEDSKVTTEEPKRKYASINRSRRPQTTQPAKEEEESDDSVEEEEISALPVTTSKTTSRYVNLSRKRITTAEPEIER